MMKIVIVIGQEKRVKGIKRVKEKWRSKRMRRYPGSAHGRTLKSRRVSEGGWEKKKKESEVEEKKI